MKSHYKRLGEYINLVDNRNRDLKNNNLIGLSIKKKFIPSISNIIGTDMSTYRIINTNQLAYCPVTSRNGEKITVALYQKNESAIISQAYTVFEITDAEKLLPEYLMMWFRRPEFDRYARYMSYGSVREMFSWDDMCDVLLPVPSIEKQKEIVKEYHVIVDRINLNNRLIQKLEETAQAIYKQWFVDFEFPDENGKPYKSNGGEMEFNKELDKDVPKNWEVKPLKSVCSKIGSGATPDGGKTNYLSSGISLIRSLNVHDFIFSLKDLAFIDNNQAKSLNNVTVEEKDILLNITGVSVARCCIAPKFILPARVNQHVIIIRPTQESYISYYILCSLCYSDNKSRLLGISQSGSTREAITKAEVELFELLIPDNKILKVFEYYMDKIFKNIELFIQQGKHLESIRDILLSRISIIDN